MKTQSKRQQVGVTLVELMVALMLGLLITGGLVQVFSANRVNYGFNEGLSRLQENGRFALDTLSHRIRLAGHFGCLRNVPVTDDLNMANHVAIDFSKGLEGFEAADTGVGDRLDGAKIDPNSSATATDWAPPLPRELLDKAIRGSDVLVVRNGSASAHALIPPFHSGRSLYAAATEDDYAAGDIVIVADCRRASVFRTAAVAAHGGGIRLDQTAHGRSDDRLAIGPGHHAFSDGAELLRAEVRVYYVGRATGGGSTALFQQRLVTDSGTKTVALAPEELVGSVDAMQVLYGVDQARDGAVDRYVTADAVTDWNRVVAVRVSLLIGSPQQFGAEVADQSYDVNGTIFDVADNRRLRQVYTTTIALRNRLP